MDKLVYTNSNGTINTNLFKFSLYDKTTIEISYDKDCNPLHKYLQLVRKGYPFRIYVKLTFDDVPMELYPLYLDSEADSIRIIRDDIPYEKPYDFKHYSYMSWDMISDSVESIYIGIGLNHIYRYENGEMKVEYITYLRSAVESSPYFTDSQKKFILTSGADMAICNLKQGKFYKFSLVYTVENRKYPKLLHTYYGNLESVMK